MQFHNQYQMVNKQSKLAGFDPRKNSSSYLIVIQNVTKLSLLDTKFGKEVIGEAGQAQAARIDPNAKFFVEYHATLYSNQVNNGLKGYYGRTATSGPIELVQEADGTYKSEAEDFMYMHTSFTE